MTELPAMDRCPVGRKGRHELSVVLPDDADKDMTLFCCQCGSLRRLPVTGAPFSGAPIDDMDAPSIASLVLSDRDFDILRRESRRPRKDADGRYRA